MRLKYLIALTAICSTLSTSALADWRDDNPNKPKGYAASMARYHYGTPGGDEPANGYRATSIRSRNGLDGYLPPENDDNWGSDDRDDRWGNTSLGRNRGGGLGRHFRQGVQEGQQMRAQGMQQARMQEIEQMRMQEIQQIRAQNAQMQVQPMANQPLAGRQRLQAIRNGYANPAVQQHPIFNYYGQ